MTDPAETSRLATDTVQTRRHRVLLIEDDDLDVLGFKRSMDSRGLDVELQRAGNAIEAFEMLRLQFEEDRDESMLIVLDLNMPAMNGLEFLAELRQDPELGSSVVMAYTTSDSADDIHSAYRHHVAGYIVKSVSGDSTEQLVDLISSYLATVRLPGFGRTAMLR